jgi:hypothetical protein
MVTQPGAWMHYYIEPIAVGSILSGIALYKLSVKLDSTRRKQIFVTALLLTALFISVGLSSLGFRPYRNVDLVYPILNSYIKETSGSILADDQTLIMLNNRTPVWESTALIQGGLLNKTWDQTDLLESIYSKEYPLIIFQFEVCNPDTCSEIQRERISIEIAESILDSYKLKATVGDYWVYEPK